MASRDELIKEIRAGYSKWSGVPDNQLEQKIPIAQHIPTMVDIAEKHNIPHWILPVLSVLESSGGQHAAIPTNPLNWGVRSGYTPTTVPEGLDKVASSFSDRPSQGVDFANSYQKPIREGNYQKAFESYEPPSQNPNYWSNAQKLMPMFGAGQQQTQPRPSMMPQNTPMPTNTKDWIYAGPVTSSGGPQLPTPTPQQPPPSSFTQQIASFLQKLMGQGQMVSPIPPGTIRQ